MSLRQIRILAATRNMDKLREIRQILAGFVPAEVVSLADHEIPGHPDEQGLERFDSFEANALAKARYFANLPGAWVLADDSGLCVDALGGAPGVRSRRFADAPGLRDGELDQANNDLLLERLRGTPSDRRSARYICAIALVSPVGDERVVTGTCEGRILTEARGGAGFGYDPLFFVPGENATFGELAADRKNQISHRARALRVAGEALQVMVDAARP